MRPIYRSHDDAYFNIKNAIVAQASQYNEAIDMSVDMATKGVTLAETAIHCGKEYLTNGDTKELKTSIDLMNGVAKLGWDAAKETEKRFGEIRSNLLKVWLPWSYSIHLGIAYLK
jgi:hypothetical protein